LFSFTDPSTNKGILGVFFVWVWIEVEIWVVAGWQWEHLRTAGKPSWVDILKCNSWEMWNESCRLKAQPQLPLGLIFEGTHPKLNKLKWFHYIKCLFFKTQGYKSITGFRLLGWSGQYCCKSELGHPMGWVNFTNWSLQSVHPVKFHILRVDCNFERYPQFWAPWKVVLCKKQSVKMHLLQGRWSLTRHCLHGTTAHQANCDLRYSSCNFPLYANTVPCKPVVQPCKSTHRMQEVES
jgi:hypothetical protein